MDPKKMLVIKAGENSVLLEAKDNYKIAFLGSNVACGSDPGDFDLFLQRNRIVKFQCDGINQRSFQIEV